METRSEVRGALEELKDGLPLVSRFRRFCDPDAGPGTAEETRALSEYLGRVDALVHALDKDNGADLEDEAYDLSTWAASVNWAGGKNTRAWLFGLRERIESVQALCSGGGMVTDAHLVLDDEETMDESFDITPKNV